jgi:hypothetical protein
MNKHRLSWLQSQLIAATLWMNACGAIRPTTAVRTINLILRGRP